MAIDYDVGHPYKVGPPVTWRNRKCEQSAVSGAQVNSSNNALKSSKSTYLYLAHQIPKS